MVRPQSGEPGVGVSLRLARLLPEHVEERGAIAVAGIATFVVVAIWFAFYLFVFTPRAMTP